MESLIKLAGEELLDVVKKAVKKTIACKKSCKRLQEKLEGMLPLLKEVLNPGVEVSAPNRQKPLTEFYDALLKGKELVEKCSELKCLDVVERYKCAVKIEVLELHIEEFIKTKGWVLLYSELYQVRVTLEAQLKNIELGIEGIGASVEEIGAYVEDKLENIENIEGRIEDRVEEILRRLIKGQIVILENDKMTSQLSIPPLPDFRFGLEKSVHDLKERLLRKSDPLVGVVGMGGSGKTTLAVAICNDPEIRGHFKKRIVFLTVSKTPNILELLGRMWVEIVGQDKPNFCNIDEAHMQLQGKLCQMELQPTLVVLDDVWKMYDLEKLTFKREGYKTLITTRNNDIVKLDWRYEKQLLEVSHAVPLFCVSAFGQQSIPEKADYNLVMEVIAKCEGLPLALQVIGKSLCDQPDHVWIIAKEKLSQGEPISEYHEDALLGRLATSIDILKADVRRECFLDMGMFPEARKISADPLLDLLVYVHGVQWQHAYAILIELASRNLVKLVNNQKGTLRSFLYSA